MSAEQSSALLQGISMVSVGFDAVTAAFLTRETPDCILAPLVIGTLDILDIAERLTELGYRGLLLAVTPPLPNPRLITSEVRAACPDLQFDLIEAPPG